ncbi:hypothetical protein ACWEVD_08000 [Nocardia thailandica]
MKPTSDPTQHQHHHFECECCDAPVERTWNVVHSDGEPVAVYYASSYHHAGRDPETWIDVILGTWDGDYAQDHVTFGCRVGTRSGNTTPAAGLVHACADGTAGPLHGTVLTRDQARTHPRLADFWAVVDHVLTSDPVVSGHLYAGTP